MHTIKRTLKLAHCWTNRQSLEFENIQRTARTVTKTPNQRFGLLKLNIGA